MFLFDHHKVSHSLGQVDFYSRYSPISTFVDSLETPQGTFDFNSSNSGNLFSSSCTPLLSLSFFLLRSSGGVRMVHV